MKCYREIEELPLDDTDVLRACSFLMLIPELPDEATL